MQEKQAEQRSPLWFAQRKHRITASVAGAIQGHAPYMTRDDVMRRMVREYHGLDGEFQGNIATEYGTNMEAGAIFDLQLAHDLDVQSCGFFTYEDWAGGTPDGLIGDDAILEVKCPFGIRNDKKPVFKTLKEQPHYYDQVQFQLLVTDRAIGYFYQWSAHGEALETVGIDHRWRIENMPLLKEFYAEYLHEREHNFKHHLELKRQEIESPKAAKLLVEYDELTDSMDFAETRKKEIIAELAKLAHDKDALICGRKFTKVEKAGSVSYAKVVKDWLPQCIDLSKYTGKKSEYWKLT